MRFTRFSSFLFSAVLLTCLSVKPIRAQTEIALTSDRSSRFQVYTLQLSPLGTPVQVTAGGAGSQLSSEPEWSPDGTVVAYQFGAPGVRGIHTIHPDGTGDVQVTPPGSGSYPCTDDTEPTWSPDSRYIAYVCQTNGIGALWKHDNQQPVNNPNSEASVFGLSKGLILNPTWTPDGSSLVFVESIPGFQPQIQIFNPSTKSLKPLTNSAFNDFDPTISPDGTMIAFSSTRNGTRQIFTMSLPCPEIQSGCPAATQLTEDPTGASHTAWSSDGSSIAFVSNRITTLNPSGRSQIYLLAPGEPESPSNPVVPVSDGTADDDFPTWRAGASLQPGKELGNCKCDGNHPGAAAAGDPIATATGNVYDQVTDYETAGQNKLRFARSYNSATIMSNPNTGAHTLGVNWRTMYDRFLTVLTPTSVTVEREDGQLLTFAFDNGAWTSDSDVDTTLVQSGSIWTLTDRNDTVETYTVTASKGNLSSIQLRGGYSQTLQYNPSNQLTSVTDIYNRTLQLTYSNGLLQTVTTPDALVLTYAYNSSGVIPGVLDRLASITYSTTPVTSQSYLYENTTIPFGLTGITDEDGNRYATWTYDNTGRALSSQHGSGADLITVSYDDATGNRTVTNALGEQEVNKFQIMQGVHKLVEVDRLATPTTASAQRLLMYDSNGYSASTTDWNGNLTTYVNDIHGDPTTINEAVGTAQARTTTIVYDLTFVHLPSVVTTTGLATSFTYDANENQLTKTLTDTTTQTVPYPTSGQTRTSTNTWQNFLLNSTKSPNGNLTKYAYDATGALISTTNALNQTTSITQHTGGGYPLVTVDPNNATTTITYDARLRLLTATISAPSQPSLTTRKSYDGAGNLTSVQLPDNSKLTYSYDAAHRLITTTDLFSNATAQTLDALGDVTLTRVTSPQGKLTRKHSGVFDALGRTLQDIGGVGQTTKYTYDNNGNPITITDADGNLTRQSFDALNRRSTVTDPIPGGVTTTAYDQRDRILSVTDANTNSTSYVYDGFGDLIQQTSPDTGLTVYHYDADANVTKTTNAVGAITDNKYDALDRVLTTTYPNDVAENVTYLYDQAGHGFGIGHLTSLKDAAGTLSRSYDDQGNMLSENRVNSGAPLKTIYTYDPASRISSVTYPSTTIVAYTRDAMGRITRVSTKIPGAGSYASVLSGISYEPFGPTIAFTYGNGVKDTRGYDLDYRINLLSDTGTGAVQKLNYQYDVANNVLGIQDGVNVGNSQIFVYDPLNRLTSGTGAYGNQTWTYDPVGNRLTQTASGVATNYGYAQGSNRLATIASAGTTQTVGTTAAGNIKSFSPAFGPVTSITYNQANRIATAKAGGGNLLQYTYDAFGQRVVKLSSATTLFQYDQSGHLLEQADGTGSAQVDYIYLGDQPIATFEASNAKVYFLHDDRLGTPQVATDSTQASVWIANYQPFGYTSTGPGIIVQDLRLPGQEFEIETGWNHNGFRDYGPTLGRYLESDPIGLSVTAVNTYVYAADNPTNRIDPFGLSSEQDENAQAVAVLGQISAANDVANTFAAEHGPLAVAAVTLVAGLPLEGGAAVAFGVLQFGADFAQRASSVCRLDKNAPDRATIGLDLLGVGLSALKSSAVGVVGRILTVGDFIRTQPDVRALIQRVRAGQ